jgi:hypothetical protein
MALATIGCAFLAASSEKVALGPRKTIVYEGVSIQAPIPPYMKDDLPAAGITGYSREA